MRTGRLGLAFVLAGVAVLAWVPAMGLSATAGPATTTDPVTIGFSCTFNGITIDDWATIQVTKPSFVQPGDEFNVSLAVSAGPTGGVDLPSSTVIYTSRAKLAVTGGTAVEAWTPEELIAPQNVKPKAPIVQLPTMTAKVVAGPSGEVKVKLSNLFVIWRLYPYAGATSPLSTFVCTCTPKQNLEVTIPIQGGSGATTSPPTTASPTTASPTTTTTTPGSGSTTTSTSKPSTSTTVQSATTVKPTTTTTAKPTTTTTAKPTTTTTAKPTTTTTAKPTTTTTAKPTTTTTAKPDQQSSSSTSTTSTSTTAVPGVTTTTTGGQSLVSTTIAPSSVLDASAVADDLPSAAPSDGASPSGSGSPSALAFTGGGVGVPLSIGIGLLVLGSALIVLERRRSR